MSNKYESIHKGVDIDEAVSYIKNTLPSSLETINTNIEQKVDKILGKDLSSNDYTDEDKAKVHTHANKAILDKITEVPLPRISWEEMDTFDGEIAVVVRSTDVQTSPSEGTHTDYRNLLIQSRHYPTYNGERDNNDFKTQLLYCEDGSIKKREFDLYEWTEWAAIASNSHTHANKAILDKITAEYTTAEKTKLSGIEDGANKYTHPESHSADMIIETATKRFTSDTELSGKVDKVTGKGLSSNDYTDEDKTKLAAIDISKQHTHTNKSILDAITDTPLTDAPSDDTIYGRKNGAWSEIINGLPTVTMEQVDVYDYFNHLPRGIYALVHDYVWETDPDYGDQMYYERDLLIVSDYTYFDEPYTTQVRYTNMGQVMRRVASWNSTSTTEWGDWSAVTYTKYEIDTALNAKADKTTVKTALTSPVTANTIYNLGKATTLPITLPSGSIGNFVQLDFISGSTATTLTVNSSSGLAGFDLIPATDTVYSLYFDWGAIGYSGNTVTYGWRFSYSEYPIASV